MGELARWEPRPAPSLEEAAGRYAALRRAHFPDDGALLFPVAGGEKNAGLWRYMPIGPFHEASGLGETMAQIGGRLGWITYLISNVQTGAVGGMASYMRIRGEHGAVEIGAILFGERMRRTPAATEAMYLLARHVFDDLGYRRYEWKCDDANDASKRAALRLGFRPEGVFRQDMVMKKRNRDTAWFSLLDAEWPAAKIAFERWLAPENFGPDGRQKRSLADIRSSLPA